MRAYSFLFNFLLFYSLLVHHWRIVPQNRGHFAAVRTCIVTTLLVGTCASAFRFFIAGVDPATCICLCLAPFFETAGLHFDARCVMCTIQPVPTLLLGGNFALCFAPSHLLLAPCCVALPPRGGRSSTDGCPPPCPGRALGY